MGTEIEEPIVGPKKKKFVVHIELLCNKIPYFERCSRVDLSRPQTSLPLSPRIPLSVLIFFSTGFTVES